MTALLPVEEAQARLLALRPPLAAQNVDISESLGRYLSHDVVALRDQPSTPLSAMDGYAIRFADRSGPWRIVGDVPAGTVPSRAIGTGEAVRIFTGAMLPDGADTVVIQEDVTADGAHLTLTRDGPAAVGQHVRHRANDFAHGSPLLSAGMRITPGAIAAAIMAGHAKLSVGTRPRVALVTTGDELVPPGQALTAGQIPNSNAAMLAALFAGEAADLSPPLHLPDDHNIISNIIRDISRRHDVIFTVGGASVGDHDHVRAALEDAGGAITFWKIAMRPGKPLIVGQIDDAVLIGLPGNPASAFVTAILFALPLIRHLAGARHPLPPVRQAHLTQPITAGGDRRDYMRALLTDGRLTPLDSRDSGQTRPLAMANALLIRDIGAAPRNAGDSADYIDIA